MILDILGGHGIVPPRRRMLFNGAGIADCIDEANELNMLGILWERNIDITLPLGGRWAKAFWNNDHVQKFELRNDD